MQDAVLIIAPEEAARKVADALCGKVDGTVEIATTRRAGLQALRSGEWSLLLLEDSLGSDPEAADLLYSSAGVATVLEMNFAVTGVARAVRQVRAALSRRVQEREQARRAVMDTLRGELRSAVAGLLLESQLALREAPPAQRAKLRSMVKKVNELRRRLEGQVHAH